MVSLNYYLIQVEAPSGGYLWSQTVWPTRKFWTIVGIDSCRRRGGISTFEMYVLEHPLFICLLNHSSTWSLTVFYSIESSREILAKVSIRPWKKLEQNILFSIRIKSPYKIRSYSFSTAHLKNWPPSTGDTPVLSPVHLCTNKQRGKHLRDRTVTRGRPPGDYHPTCWHAESR